MGPGSGRRYAHAHPLTEAARAADHDRAPRVQVDRATADALRAATRALQPARRPGPISTLLLIAVSAALLISGQAAMSGAGLPPGSGTSAVAGAVAGAIGQGGVTVDPSSMALAGGPSDTGAAPLPSRHFDPFEDAHASGRSFAPLPESLTGYRWPLQHARITQAFGRSSGGLFIVDGEGFHDGIDIASFCGDHVVAAHDGVVIATGRHVDFALGWDGDVAAYHARLDAKQAWSSVALVVVIDDGNGYRSIYVHFHRIVVTRGQHVRAGDLLGTEGSTGHATGCHLHYGLFSPLATDRYQTDPEIVRRILLPAAEIARIDPLIPLPPLTDAFITWGWGAREKP
jgi:murein DD-endopeptidase MepM/ murein hydrolase activator NlpD